MKKTVNEPQVTEKIGKYSNSMGGVFSTADLFNLIGSSSREANKRTIRRLEEAGILTRCRKGLYVTKEFDLWRLANRVLNDDGYISMESVLARNALIGTLPSAHVSVVMLGRSRKPMRIRNKRIYFYSIKNDLFFGFSRSADGIPAADNEKAFIDLLYYYQHGYRFIIDPKQEVNVARLDRRKIAAYLKRYKNRRFVSFVKGVLNG